MGLGVAGTAAAIGAAGAVASAGASIYGSNKAAASAKDAANQQQQQYNQTRGDLVPYFDPGQQAIGNALTLAQGSPTGGGPDYVSQAAPYIGQAAGYIGQQAGAVGQAAQNLPGQMTQAQLEATPGYQFTRDQGLKSIQSANAAKGLGVSGAALKGAATYATGLADKTYMDQFNVAQQRFTDYLNVGAGYGNAATGAGNLGANTLNLNTAQQAKLSNQFARYNSIATIGEAAAAGLGAQGTQAASNQGNYLNAAGIDQAQGIQGVGNALNSGANNYLALQAYNARTAATPSNANTPGTIGYNTPTNSGLTPNQLNSIYQNAI